MTKGQQDGTTTQDFNMTGTGYLQLDVSVTGDRTYIFEQTATSYGMLTSNINAYNSTFYYCGEFIISTYSSNIPSIGGNAGSLDSGVSTMFFMSTNHTANNLSSSLSYHAP